jgi:hypothetical protein
MASVVGPSGWAKSKRAAKLCAARALPAFLAELALR